MAPITDVLLEPSLPKLLALGKNHNDFDQAIKEAARVAGISLLQRKDPDENEIGRSRPSRIRSEFVLKWTLEKLKTASGRKDYCNSKLLWPLLQELLRVVPASLTARLLQSSGFTKNLVDFLEECAQALSDAANQHANGPLPLNGAKKSTKKRKRGEKEPSPPSVEQGVSRTKIQGAVLSITSLLQSITALSKGELIPIDAAGGEYVASTLRMSSELAARVLDAWLRCLRHFISNAEAGCSLFYAHDTVLNIWSSRVREQNDETGASPKNFSKFCLVSLSALLAEVSGSSESTDVQKRIKVSLEELLSKHILVPAHTLFDTAQSTRHPDLQRAQSALNEYLEPLRSTISEQLAKSPKDGYGAKELIVVLPQLLDLAIRLSPSSTPTQRSAQVPWLESVFSTLSTCAMEPLPHHVENFRPQEVQLSPLVPMLQVLKERGVNLSSDFLESILVGYSGLDGLWKEAYTLRLDIVAALLDLNGGVFLKDAGAKEPGTPTVQASQPPYVQSLMASLSEITWAKHDDQVNDTNSSRAYETTNFAVQHLLIPLLRAYAAARKLPSFISLWFGEIRRHWKLIGGPEEERLPWLSQGLVQSFGEQLEGSLSATRISELLVEFILPVRQLLDELSKGGSKKLEWTDVRATAPACAALVILETFVHSIEREDTLQQNQVAWKALKDLPGKLALLDLADFPAASRIWSILARVYKLSYWVDGKEAFSAQQKLFLEEDEIIQRAIKRASWPNSEATTKGSDLEALEALHFVFTVCDYELNAPLSDTAQSVMLSANQGFILSAAQATWSVERTPTELLLRLEHTLSFFVQFPSTLPLLTKDAQEELFGATVLATANLERTTLIGLLNALILTLVEGERGCLDNVLSVFSDFVTSGSKEAYQVTAIDCFQAISPNLLSRARREHIIDNIACLHANVKEPTETEPSPDLAANGVALLLRLLSCPNPTAKLCTEPLKTFTLADTLDSIIQRLEKQGRPFLGLLQSIDSLFKLIMRQALIDATEERRKSYYAAFVEITGSQVEDLLAIKRSKKSVPLQPVVVIMMKCFLIIAQHLNADSPTLATVRTGLHSLLAQLKLANAQSAVWHWVILNTVAETLPTVGGGPDPKDLELAQQLIGDDQIVSGPATIPGIELASFLDPKTAVGPFVARLDKGLSPQEYGQVLSIFEQRIQNMRACNKLMMVADLVASGHTQNLQMLHVLIKRLSADDASDFDTGKQVLLQLCDFANRSTEIGSFGAATSCINTILRTRAFLITQHGIDTLLSTLTTLSSSQAPPLPAEHAGFIYNRLCQLTISTILLHRRRLGGRMHLLVSLLQNLMSCLFSPHRYQTTASSARPPWLSSSHNLDTEHAISFTRVLTTLCSPTVSSTLSHRGFRMADANLVDETKKAKEYAGQYVSYVILHYCTLQLQHSVAPEVGEKLKMGVWAMMEVVDIEAMRGMNAGMGREERVVWGALYAEWNRIGRFKLT